MIHSTIISELNTRLKTISGLPQLLEENTRGKLGSGKTSFCKTTLLPANTSSFSVGVNGENRNYGIFQVDLYYPQGQGTTSSYDMGDKITDSFVAGLTLSNVRIVNSTVGNNKGKNTKDNYYHLNVDILYENFTTRPNLI
jgi:hypothetical protein